MSVSHPGGRPRRILGELPLPPFPDQTMPADRWQLHARRAKPSAADAPPAVYVHGLGGSSLNWTDLQGLLQDHVDGYALDLPGFGDSPPPPDADYSISGHARAVVAFIQALGRGPVHLFGNSMGGAISTRVAAEHPELVRTLTLISPALPDLRVRRTNAPTAMMGVPGVGHLLAQWLHSWPPERRATVAADLIFADPATSGAAWREMANQEFARRAEFPWSVEAFGGSIRGLLRAYFERGPQALWNQARQVSAPTLLLYGRQDKLVSSRLAIKAAETFPNCRVITLPNSGHVAMMEHPYPTAMAVLELFAESSRGGGQARVGRQAVGG